MPKPDTSNGSRQTIAAAASLILAAGGPLWTDELVDKLVAGGVTRARNPRSAVSTALRAKPRFRYLDDGRWVDLALLLEGAVFAHRLSSHELTGGWIVPYPDLAPLVPLILNVWRADPDGPAFDWVLLERGDPAFASDADDEGGKHDPVGTRVLRPAIVGPPGWLDGFTRGDLIRFRVRNGFVDVVPPDDPAASKASDVEGSDVEASQSADDLAGAVRAVFGRGHFLVTPRPIEDAIAQALLSVPDAFQRSSAPLGDVLRSGGLQVDENLVAPAGVDWSRWRHLLHRIRLPPRSGVAPEPGSLRETFDLEEFEAEGAGIVLGAIELYERLGHEPEGDIVERLAQMVSIPRIAGVLALEAVKPGSRIEPFVEALADKAVGRWAAGPLVVLAMSAEARDDAIAAERLVARGLAADPDFGPALLESAGFASDRGDARAALGYLRRAGLDPSDPEIAELEELSRPLFAGTGRNAPCPCRSGRKYKACHGASSAQPLRRRASWLYQRARVWAVHPARRSTVRPIAERISGSDDEDEILFAVFEDPVVHDIALFEGGLLRRYLDSRAKLLPADELALGRIWQSRQRSLYEVVGRPDGDTLSLRDLATGERLAVTDRMTASHLGPLELIYARALEDGEGGHLFGTGIILLPRSVRPHFVAELGSGTDPFAVVRWLKGRPALRLQTSEGEPLVVCSAVFRLPDPAAARKALARTLRDEGDGLYLDVQERPDDPFLGEDTVSVRGRILVEGSRATLEAYSDRRMERLRATLLRAAPGAQLLEERRIDGAKIADQSVEPSEDSSAGRRSTRSSGRGPRAGGSTGRSAKRASGPAPDAVESRVEPPGEVSAAMDRIIRRMERQWVDEAIPALGGLSPREALASPQERDELVALLNDMDWLAHRSGGASVMDPGRIRSLLGIAPPD